MTRGSRIILAVGVTLWVVLFALTVQQALRERDQDREVWHVVKVLKP